MSPIHVPYPRAPTPVAGDVAPDEKRNCFQFDIPSLVRMMRSQVGSQGTASVLALNGWWGKPTDVFAFVIQEVNASYGDGLAKSSKHVALLLCDDGRVCECPPSFFLRDDVFVAWRATFDVPPGRDESDPRRHNAFLRAKEIGALFAGKREEQQALSAKPLPPAVIVTLDGDGRNRRAFHAAFAERGALPPRVVAYEKDAVVALCQRLCGYEVYLTGADLAVRSKKGKGGAVRSPLVEHLALAGRVPRDAGLVYLDYCGGPPSDVDMTRVLASFPDLLVYASTVSHRKHPGAERGFEEYVPTLYGFREEGKFSTNRRVVSKVFSLDPSVRRVVSIPGCFWENCPGSLKRKRFSGVLVDGENAAVDTERGREVVFLNKRARVAYLA